MFDRLVRQGRAFGIHVILGSQTLSGAFSLPRSTLGQMGVRIALQCSDADAQVILNEDNSAAKFLSRPGEAIYNDANGMKEGNHHFQVVWLPDAVREVHLKRIAQLTAERGIVPRPQIVFEGNLPSDLTRHPIFSGDRPGNTTTPKTLHAWLGEAVAIKDPTSAAFRPQGGANLLMVGQNEELASGVMAAAIVGLAAQAPIDTKFYILDGTPEESTYAGTFARFNGVIPQAYRIGGLREAGSILGEVAAEVERRQSGGGESSPMFLVIHDLPRFRDLRKQEDDFSFSRRGKEETISPAKALGNILREGPALGVHTLVWCDSVNNMNRAFDRQALREFEMRVLFQIERIRLQQPDRFARRSPAGRESRALLQRGAGPHREIPSLRIAARRMAKGPGGEGVEAGTAGKQDAPGCHPGNSARTGNCHSRRSPASHGDGASREKTVGRRLTLLGVPRAKMGQRRS